MKRSLNCPEKFRSRDHDNLLYEYMLQRRIYICRGGQLQCHRSDNADPFTHKNFSFKVVVVGSKALCVTL